MNPNGLPQSPEQPMEQLAPQTPAQGPAPDSSPAFEQHMEHAKPGFRGIWVDPEKYDTSDWNTFYYFFRQIAQHKGLKLKQLKWIALLVDIYFLVTGIVLWVAHVKAGFPSQSDMTFNTLVLLVIGLHPALVLFLLLTIIPTVMVGQAFKVRTRNIGFMTSRAKDPPLLLHLVEYTSGKGLISGVVQSMIYSFTRLFLFLTPAFLIITITGVFLIMAYPAAVKLAAVLLPLGKITLILLMGALATMNFVTMQGFSFRLDTLCFAILLAVETFSNFFIAYTYSSAGFVGRSFYTLILMWAICMAYFPLAAADTIEYGIGKHARTIRLFLLGVILVNFLSLFGRVRLFSVLFQDKQFDIMKAALMPSLWILVSVMGLLVSSLSAASYRAKHHFRLHASTAKNVLLVRLFDPTSPISVIPILALEIAIAAFFVAITRDSSAASFWKGSENEFTRKALMIAFLVWPCLHFALTFMFFARRHSHKERLPWLTHPQFNMLFFILLAVLGVVWALSGGTIVFPFFYFVMSAMGLFIIWEPVNDPDEIRPAELPSDFGRADQ